MSGVVSASVSNNATRTTRPVKLGGASPRNHEAMGHKRSTILGAHMTDYVDQLRMEKPLELRIETVQHTPPQTSPRTASVSPRERKAKQNFECKDLKELLKKPQTVEVDLARMT